MGDLAHRQRSPSEGQPAHLIWGGPGRRANVILGPFKVKVSEPLDSIPDVLAFIERYHQQSEDPMNQIYGGPMSRINRYTPSPCPVPTDVANNCCTTLHDLRKGRGLVGLAPTKNCSTDYDRDHFSPRMAKALGITRIFNCHPGATRLIAVIAGDDCTSVNCLVGL